jgi:glutamyl-tRNA reductase
MADKLGPNGETRINPDDALLAAAPDNVVKGVGGKVGSLLLSKMPKTKLAIEKATEQIGKQVSKTVDKLTPEKIKELTEKVKVSASPEQKAQIKTALEKLKKQGPEVQSVKFPDLGKTTTGTAVKDGMTKPTKTMEYSTEPYKYSQVNK